MVCLAQTTDTTDLKVYQTEGIHKLQVINKVKSKLQISSGILQQKDSLEKSLNKREVIDSVGIEGQPLRNKIHEFPVFPIEVRPKRKKN